MEPGDAKEPRIFSFWRRLSAKEDSRWTICFKCNYISGTKRGMTAEEYLNKRSPKL